MSEQCWWWGGGGNELFLVYNCSIKNLKPNLIRVRINKKRIIETLSESEDVNNHFKYKFDRAPKLGSMRRLHFKQR